MPVIEKKQKYCDLCLKSFSDKDRPKGAAMIRFHRNDVEGDEIDETEKDDS